jgi:hypothetical protein
LKTEAEDLAWLRSLGIASAPEVAALIPVGHGYVIVRRYWACPGEQLLPVPWTNVVFREAARKRLRRDMEVLVEHGKIHPYAGRGFSHWSVGQASGTIVLDNWYMLRPYSPYEREAFLESIDKLLARGIEQP